MSISIKDLHFCKRKKISELSMLSCEEQEQIKKQFNNTFADYPRDKCVHQLFEEQVLKTPDKTAVIACDKTLTYDELNRLSNRIAFSLTQRGIGSGDIVAFALTRRSFLIATMIGTLKSGAAYMPIDPAYPQERIDFMIEDSGAKLLVTETNIAELLNNENEENPSVKNSPNDNFCILHTSGSTGMPKCAAIMHKNMMNFIFSSAFLVENIENVVAINTVTFDVFEMDTIFALVLGKTCILASEEQQFVQSEFENMMSQAKHCLFWATPTKMLNYINNSLNKSFAKNIDCYVVGGEIVTPEFIDTVYRNNTDIEIYTVYGPTETLIYSTLVKIL